MIAPSPFQLSKVSEGTWVIQCFAVGHWLHFEKGNTKTNNNTFKTFPVSGYLFLGKLLLTQSYHFNRFDRLNFFLTGGWASASYPHMVVYCIKFVLRGESPRDDFDMLRSLAFPPSINISDMPHRIATPANITVPHFFQAKRWKTISADWREHRCREGRAFGYSFTLGTRFKHPESISVFLRRREVARGSSSHWSNR